MHGPINIRITDYVYGAEFALSQVEYLATLWVALDYIESCWMKELEWSDCLFLWQRETKVLLRSATLFTTNPKLTWLGMKRGLRGEQHSHISTLKC